MKTFYGFRQFSRAWYERIDVHLSYPRFEKNEIDPNVNM